MSMQMFECICVVPQIHPPSSFFGALQFDLPFLQQERCLRQQDEVYTWQKLQFPSLPSRGNSMIETQRTEKLEPSVEELSMVSC